MKIKKVVMLVVLPLVALTLTQEFASAENYDSRQTRIEKGCAKGAVAVGMLGYIVKRGRGAAIGAAAGCAAEAFIESRGQRRRDDRMPTRAVATPERENRMPGTPAPSLEEQAVTICFKYGDRCRVGNNSVEGLIQSTAEQVFQRLGAMILQSSNREYPCENNGPKVICVQYNARLVTLGGGDASDNQYLNLAQFSTSNRNSGRNEKYGLTVTVVLYENTSDKNGKLNSRRIVLANANGVSDAGSEFAATDSSLRGEGGSISGGRSRGRFSTRDQAEWAAAQDGTRRLANGEGWFPNAASYIAGN